jgi:hypothetical protein
MECIIVFGIATYAAHYLTKNRAIDIFAGLFVSNVLFGCGRIKEGFHTGTNVDIKKMTLEQVEQQCKDTIAAAQAASEQAEEKAKEAGGADGADKATKDAAEDAIKAAKKAKTALEEAKQHCEAAKAALKAAKKN